MQFSLYQKYLIKNMNVKQKLHFDNYIKMTEMELFLPDTHSYIACKGFTIRVAVRSFRIITLVIMNSIGSMHSIFYRRKYFI